MVDTCLNGSEFMEGDRSALTRRQPAPEAKRRQGSAKRRAGLGRGGAKRRGHDPEGGER